MHCCCVCAIHPLSRCALQHSYPYMHSTPRLCTPRCCTAHWHPNRLACVVQQRYIPLHTFPHIHYPTYIPHIHPPPPDAQGMHLHLLMEHGWSYHGTPLNEPMSTRSAAHCAQACRHETMAACSAFTFTPASTTTNSSQHHNGGQPHSSGQTHGTGGTCRFWLTVRKAQRAGRGVVGGFLLVRQWQQWVEQEGRGNSGGASKTRRTLLTGGTVVSETSR